MKKLILGLALLGGLFLTANTASARGVIVYSNGEKIEIVKKLPAETVMKDGNHVNLGVMYEQFSIFWVPMWNYGETKYVLINDKEDTYYDVDSEDIEAIKTQFEIDIPAEPSIGFWNKIGGKLIWGVIILVVIWLSTRKDDDKKTETTDAEETSQKA